MSFYITINKRSIFLWNNFILQVRLFIWNGGSNSKCLLPSPWPPQICACVRVYTYICMDMSLFSNGKNQRNDD